MAKRSCDFCVQRKTRCDNGRPCRKCLDAQPPLECTYLKPVLKRGPKTSKLTQRCNWKWRIEAQNPPPASPGLVDPTSTVAAAVVPAHYKTERLPLSILRPVIEAYSSRMYPVWPVLHVPDLLNRLEKLETTDPPDPDVYAMTLALCSATIAQLNLTAMEDIPPHITSEYMEKECNRHRNLTNYREHPSVEGALTSFFLHVFHAKADNRNASMVVFLQEGISIARLLRLDRIELESCQLPHDLDNGQAPVTAHKRLVYILLWVSERGYAIQHDLPISILDTVQIPADNMDDFDKYGKGLIELATLFAAFDAFFYRTAQYMYETCQGNSEQHRLITVQRSLESIAPKAFEYDLVQRADYNITRHWMRILIWQQAMSQSLLSSRADDDSMTFLFPSQIAQDFLASITINSKEHLVSLGRDQLIKSFEITNTLADVILCTTSAYSSPHIQDSCNSRRISYFGTQRERWKYGPADFLHAMYQTISPFLTYDKRLYNMIRLKAADALLRSPSRIIPRGVEEGSQEAEVGEDEEDKEESGGISVLNLEFTTGADTWNIDTDLGGLDLRLDVDALGQVTTPFSSDTL